MALQKQTIYIYIYVYVYNGTVTQRSVFQSCICKYTNETQSISLGGVLPTLGDSWNQLLVIAP